jgi:hypothetical protein
MTTNYIDGASLVTIGLGIAAVFSFRAFSRQMRRLAIHIGLPQKMPRVPYEWLPLALAPFLLVGYTTTKTLATSDGTVSVTSGYGNSPTKLWLLIMLCLLIYLAKLRARLKAIEGRI